MTARKDGKPKLLGAQHRPIEQRLWGRMKCMPNGCWIFEGTILSTGYGGIHYLGKFRRAHQVAWMLSGKGELPRWPMVIDHKCGELRCINPEHLRIVPHVKNCMELAHKGNSPFLINRMKTACKRGHEFTPENTAMYKAPRMSHPTRVCLTCWPHYWRWAIIPRDPPPISNDRAAKGWATRRARAAQKLLPVRED